MKLIIIVTITILLQTACSQQPVKQHLSCDISRGSGVYLGANIITSTPSTVRKVVFLNKEYEGVIEVCTTAFKSTTSPALSQNMTLVNMTNNQYQFELKTYFYHQDGTPSEKASSWSRIIVPANGKAHYNIQSTSRITPAYLTVEIGEGS